MNGSEFRKNFQPSVLLPSLTAGLINAIIMISVEISFAALIFSGDLQQFLPRGIGIMLFGTCIISIIVSLTSSLVGMISLPQDTPAALIALAGAAIALTMQGQNPETIYSTVIGAIIFSSFLTALLFIALGWFKASSFVRYVPYPVVGGFLAGTGYLLGKGALGIMVDIPLAFGTLPRFFAPDVLWHWLPGILFGLILYMILRRYNHFLIMPGAVIIAITIFYVFLFFAGISVQEASAGGWLLGPFPEGGLFKLFTLDNWAQIQWSAVFGNFGTFVTLFGLSVISLLLNASGLEVIYKQDIDLDRELISAGGATLIGSFFGCIVSYQTLGLSALASKFGVKSRLAGVFAGIFCGLALFFGASAISYFPKMVLGGMLFLLGLSFMVEWLIDAFKTLPRMDYVLIWVMLFIIGYFGFLQAIGAGVVIAALLFVVSYGSVSAIKNTLSGSSFHSKVGRSEKHARVLTERGEQIHILRLQGFIFFGSIQRVLQSIHERMAMSDILPMNYLVLDFQHVKRLDSSAVFGITRIKQLTDANQTTMIWTNLLEDIRKQVEHSGLAIQESDTFSIQPTLDYGMEWCENKLLAIEGSESKLDFVHNTLLQMSRSFPDIKRVQKHMEKVELQPGEYLFRQGETSDGMFFIEKGLLAAELDTADGKKERLLTFQSGATVGEIAMYLGGQRTASIKAEQQSIVYRLSSKNMNAMRKEDPALAALLHEWIARTLAERLAENNLLIKAFLD